MSEEAPVADLKPLLIDWLTQWKNAASRTGSRMEFVYKNALKSLRAFDQPVKSAKECRQIKYFGEKLCERVKYTLRDHCEKNGIAFEEEDEPECGPGPSRRGKSWKEKENSESSQSGPGPSRHGKSWKGKEKGNSESSQSAVDGSEERKVERKQGSSRSYVPQPRSGSFAILVTLLKGEMEGVTKMTKTQIVQDGQEYCDESLSKPRNGSYFTAFSSMKTLVKKQLVTEERHRCSEYSLTEEGRTLAQKLLNYIMNSGGAINTGLMSSQENGISTQSSPLEFQLTNFDIILLVDTRESMSGVDSSLKKTALMANLTQLSVPVEMRALPVGDFAWIARERSHSKIAKVSASHSSSSHSSSSHSSSSHSSSSHSQTLTSFFPSTKSGFISNKPRRELILDYVVERKRVDDLVSSIIDGRFHEQKHRLKGSGVRKPIYLVESLTKGEYSVPYRSLLQAVNGSQINDGFNVKFTKDHSETICYLVVMTRSLMRKYRGVVLTSCPREELGSRGDDYLMTYLDFESGSKKMTNFTATEMFLKQLLQFSGMSVRNAIAITQRFPTLLSLVHAYHSSSLHTHREFKQLINLIALIKPHSADRTIGPALANKLMITYCKNIPLVPPKIRGNSAKIRGSSAKIRGNSTKIRGSSAEIKANSAEIKVNSAD